MKILLSLCLLATALAQAPIQQDDGSDSAITNPCAVMLCRAGSRCEVINGEGRCIRTMHTPAQCMQSVARGSRCTGKYHPLNFWSFFRLMIMRFTKKYYYYPKGNICLPFNFRGCSGNSNRFSSRGECMRKCAASVKSLTTKRPYPPWKTTRRHYTTRRPYPPWKTTRRHYTTRRPYPPWMTPVPPAVTAAPQSCDYRNNEVWSRCHGHCDAQCWHREPRACAAVCISGCICRRGYARDNNRCIRKGLICSTTTTLPPPTRLICPDGSTPERSYTGQQKFCGRGPGREDCGRGFSCEIHPADAYAICCPSRVTPGPPTPPGQVCPDGSRPEQSRLTRRDKFCGLSPMAESCSHDYYCNVHPTDRYAFCCKRHVPTTPRPCTPPPCPTCVSGYSYKEERNRDGCVTRCYCKIHTREEACKLINCHLDYCVLRMTQCTRPPCPGPVAVCDHSSGQSCPDGSRPEVGSDGSAKFCGRGPNWEDCGSGYTCQTDPLDHFAFCCPDSTVCRPVACPVCMAGYKHVKEYSNGCLVGCRCVEMTMDEACRLANCPRGQKCQVSTPLCVGGRCRGPVGHCFPDCPMYKCRPCPPGQKIGRLPNGCQDGCNCVPDCRGACGPDEKCELQKVTCVTEPCYPVPTCVPAASDENPCNLVDCRPDTPYCVVRSWDCNPRWKSCRKPEAVCIADTTNDVCPYSGCPMDCGVEYLLEHGCPVCRCSNKPSDPCGEIDCEDGKVCIKVQPNCEGIGCVPFGRCVDPSNSCPQAPCNLICKGGKQTDQNGCQICRCRTCDPVCAPGQRCVFEKVTCKREPCLPNPVCKPMCPLVRCVPCQEGLVRHYDEDGCQTCQCRVKTCKDIKCPTGKVCKLHDSGMRCVRAPCASFVPECVAVVACTKIGCAPCADGERLEQIMDTNGCLTGCKCHQQRPCATHKCEDDQICIDIIPECFPQSGCPPSAECRDRPDVCYLSKDSGRQCSPPAGPATTPPPVGQPHGVPSTVYPRTFYNRDTRRCEGFGYQGCGGNKNRFTSLNDCKRTCMGDAPVPVVTPPPLNCRANMVVNDCVSPCQRKPTCELPNPDTEPPCKAMCIPMCVCKPGYVNNDLGVCIPLSQCRQTCKTKKCDANQYCDMLYPPCPAPPEGMVVPPDYCSPVPVCRTCDVPDCLKYVKCATGVIKDQNGCYSRTCRCNPEPIPTEPCNLPCPRGYICVNNGGRQSCVADCQPVRCKMYCEHGWAKDNRGCNICQCAAPPTTTPQPAPTCDDVNCREDEKCELRQVQCVTTPCHPQPTCVPDCQPVRCRMYCEHGWAKDNRGCNICQCAAPPTTTPQPAPTCDDVDCNEDEKCELRQVQCITTPCHPQPTCVPRCKAYEVFNSCGSACDLDPTCAVPNPAPGTCTADCRPRCECQSGYIRDENARCILINECPTPDQGAPPRECRANQHENRCTNPSGCYVEPTCRDPHPQPSDRMCTTGCIRRCVCDAGYIRADDGNCVLPDQCPST